MEFFFESGSENYRILRLKDNLCLSINMRLKIYVANCDISLLSLTIEIKLYAIKVVLEFEYTER